MRQTRQATSWVVYERPATARMPVMKFVCERGEWDRLEKDYPNWTLVLSGITNEGQAERAARDATVALRDDPRRRRSA